MIERHHENLHKKISEQKNQYKVPMKFMMDYLKEKNIDTSLILESDAAEMATFKTIESEPNVLRKTLEHEIRAAYLTNSIRLLEEQHKRALREQLTKLENKIRIYTTECIRVAQKSLIDDWRFIFVQLESFKLKEQELEKENMNLQQMLRMAESRVTEVAIWAKADEAAHDEFTDQLIEDGIDEDDLIQVSLDVE